MSDRTVFRFALAGLLAAALASPVVAQVSGPPQAPMPRAGCNRVPDQFELFVEVRETATGNFLRGAGQEFRVVGPGQPCPTPPCCRQAVNSQAGLTGSIIINERNFGAQACPAQLSALGCATGSARAQESCCDKAGKLAGTWVRDFDVAVLAATFSGDELKLCITQSAEGHTLCFTITADYTLTKDGLVHGVVTGIDVDCKTDPKQCRKGDDKQSMVMELLELSAGLQDLVDCPFSFRVKHTSAGVMVSGLKFATVGGISSKEAAMLCGMYKPAPDGKVPCPSSRSTVQTLTGGVTLPSGRYLEHYPQYFAPDPVLPLPRELAAQECPKCGVERVGIDFGPAPACPVPAMPQPVVPAGNFQPAAQPMRMVAPLPPGVTGCGKLPACPQPGWCPTPAANVPAGEFGMMAEVFGQMLGGQATCKPGPAPPPTATYINQPPAYIAPPPPCPVPAGLPAPGFVPPAPPCNVMPTVCYAQSAPAMPSAAKPVLAGTWYRELGPKLCVIKLASDHFTVTVTEATEIEDGKTMTASIVLTADYQMARDGTTAVGLVTSIDLKYEGDVPAEVAADLLTIAAECQKALEDKPFAMTIRLYGDAVVIGNVRMPELTDSRLDVQPAALVGGRYKNIGDKMLPKPKPSKPALINRYSDGPSILNLPLGEPFGSSVTPVGVTSAPDAAPPATPVPPMPQPTPPGPVVKPMSAKQQKYSTDPNVRLQQLLYQQDDLRKVNTEWRRFWFNNQPSHLVPERIHGGIY